MYTYFSDIGLSLEKKQYLFNDKIKSMWLRGIDFICFWNNWICCSLFCKHNDKYIGFTVKNLTRRQYLFIDKI